MGAIARTGIRPAVISHRTHFGNVGGIDGEAFFNGESLRIRRIIGCDWSNEGPRISQMQFVAGNPSGMTDPAGVLISDVTARRLRASVGDQIILQVIREGGAINTVPVG